MNCYHKLFAFLKPKETDRRDVISKSYIIDNEAKMKPY